MGWTGPGGWTKSSISDFQFPVWQRRIRRCRPRNGANALRRSGSTLRAVGKTGCVSRRPRSPYPLPNGEGTIQNGFTGFRTENGSSKGRNLVVTVLFVPNSLDSRNQVRHRPLSPHVRNVTTLCKVTCGRASKETVGFGFRVSGFGFLVSGFGFRVSGFGFRISGFGFQIPNLFRV